MATIRDRLALRDQELFVARTAELEQFDAVLAGAHPHRVIHLFGPGGIGKSALMREVVRRARAGGVETIWLDGRDIAPFPAEIDAALTSVTESVAALVVFDSYELASSLDSHLRDTVIPELPDTTVVVFVSRHAPAPSWFADGWDRITQSIELGALESADARALAEGHGVTDDSRITELIRRSHGSPLALVVGAEAGPSNTQAGLVGLAGRLLGDEVDPSRTRTLSVAALARVTTPELLEEVVGDGDPQESFKWLATRTFSEPLAAGVTLHALVAEAVRDQIRAGDPIGEANLRRRIADHLHRRALAGQHGLSTDLQHLVVDPDVKWGFSADVGNRYRIDSIRPGDSDLIGDILIAVGVEEWWLLTRVFFDEHPEFCGVARDPDGRIGGYFVAVAPDNAPPAAERDPLLGPWLRYAREELRTNSAVLWREAVDLTGEMGEVTSLLGAGGLLSTGVPNPRYGFLPISPIIPAALQFSEALGARHVPELDVRTHGMELDCHVVDFGPTGLIGFQRDWIYRESGAPPPSDVPEIDAAALLRLLRDPDGLARGPIWLGTSPSIRLERLRSLVTGALVVFGSHHDDQIARSIIEAAYLEDAQSHESIARRLHLSRSAYFRRLGAATERVGEEIASIARHDR